MLKVIAHNYIKEESIDTVSPLFKELIETTQKENGCIGYNLYIDEADSTHFVFVEEWESHEALEAHSKSEHFTRIVPQIKQHAYKEGSIVRMKLFK